MDSKRLEPKKNAKRCYDCSRPAKKKCRLCGAFLCDQCYAKGDELCDECRWLERHHK